ncbi:MAG TPA: hypothetical protein VNL15_00705 [Dehalococcoidia bacterium]|nr:hypothetical protein [Dehalococcoidia bacterium]
MRFLAQITIPNDAGNTGLLDGSLLGKIQRYIEEVKPEAVYAAAEGQRTLFMILNIESSDRIPELLEPLWIDLEADVHLVPVLNAEEFARAQAGIERVVKARQ